MPQHNVFIGHGEGDGGTRGDARVGEERRVFGWSGYMVHAFPPATLVSHSALRAITYISL